MQEHNEEHDVVAPVRERGLKYRMSLHYLQAFLRRSREGAWIEILTTIIYYT